MQLRRRRRVRAAGLPLHAARRLLCHRAFCDGYTVPDLHGSNFSI